MTSQKTAAKETKVWPQEVRMLSLCTIMKPNKPEVKLAAIQDYGLNFAEELKESTQNIATTTVSYHTLHSRWQSLLLPLN